MCEPGRPCSFIFVMRPPPTKTSERLLAGQQKLGQAAGGLLFSCNGRGTRMFRTSGHDIGLAGQTMPETPIAGFFAAGEFGPVGGKNFIHGHTASFGLFRKRAVD